MRYFFFPLVFLSILLYAEILLKDNKSVKSLSCYYDSIKNQTKKFVYFYDLTTDNPYLISEEKEKDIKEIFKIVQNNDGSFEFKYTILLSTEEGTSVFHEGNGSCTKLQ